MLPTTWVLAGFAPMARNRSASPSPCAAITMPCESVSRNSPASMRYRPTERGEMRALANTSGMPRLPQPR